MSKTFKLICIGLLSILIGIVSPSVLAKKGGNPGKGHGKGSMQGVGSGHGKGHKLKSVGKGRNYDGPGSKQALSARSISKVNFSDNDRENITNFFSKHPVNTTGLPPGIAMNLARGKPLPPGIAKVFLPNDLSNLLGNNKNYDYLIAGRDVLLVNRSDQIIADILHNILP